MEINRLVEAALRVEKADSLSPGVSGRKRQVRALTILGERRPPKGWQSSGIQSRGECQRTKSSSSAPGLAALNADMSDDSRSPCSRALAVWPEGDDPAGALGALDIHFKAILRPAMWPCSGSPTFC